MLPEYILTILRPFALKCAKDRLNNLVHQADGRMPYKTNASLEALKTKLSDFHTFGSPCYVLDACLQSGLKAIPKWETQAWMGMYVGQTPSHASNISLILNSRTGHILPQFCVVYDDDFTMVSYL